MTAARPEQQNMRQGWCPGALRPMESGDGLIVRLRLTGGAIAPDLGRAIAGWATSFGNRLMDVSIRANLQLRGITEHTLQPLQDALATHHLLDENADAESVRNVMASPLAGYDPSALLDIRPHIQALEAQLQQDTSLHRLPGKFGFLIEDGGCLPLRPDMADIAFIACIGEQTPRFAIYLGGKPAGFCDADRLVDTAASLGQAFLVLRGSGIDAPRRMAALVKRIDVSAVLAEAGMEPAPPLDRPAIHLSTGPLGLHALKRHQAFGVGLPFGRIDAEGLMRLSAEAEAVQGELRLTPWRAILIVGKPFDSGLADRMRQAGFILDNESPIRAVAACPGSPACARGSTNTHADATILAPLARGLADHGVTLHVSGCTKGCAHPKQAPVTLVGRNGTYDVVLDGSAGDKPVLQGLNVRTDRAALTRLFESGKAS